MACRSVKAMLHMEAGTHCVSLPYCTQCGSSCTARCQSAKHCQAGR